MAGVVRMGDTKGNTIAVAINVRSDAQGDVCQRAEPDPEDWFHTPALRLLGTVAGPDEDLDGVDSAAECERRMAAWKAPLEVTAKRIVDAMTKVGASVTWAWYEPEDDAPYINVCVGGDSFIIVTHRWVNDTGGHTDEAVKALDLAADLGVFDWVIGEP